MKLIMRHVKLFSRTISNFSNELIYGTLKDEYLPTKFHNRSPIITIFGGSGFLGKYVIEELKNYNYQFILPYRGSLWEIRSSLMMGSVNQTLMGVTALDCEESLINCIKDSSAVINMIGKEYENYMFSFEKIHIEFPSKLAKLCKKLGTKTFIHISALGAKEKPEPIILSKGSRFLQTKWLGEKEVLKEFPEAIILRPATIWGRNDRFIFYYTDKSRRRFSSFKFANIPLWKMGTETVKQPIYAGDIGKAIRKILFQTQYNGSIFELAGPERFRLDHLVIWFYLNLKYDIENIKITDLSKWFIMKSKFETFMLPSHPFVTAEYLEKESTTEVVDETRPNMQTLNIRLCRLEDRLQWLLKSNFGIGYSWDDSHVSFHAPPPPPTAI